MAADRRDSFQQESDITPVNAKRKRTFMVSIRSLMLMLFAPFFVLTALLTAIFYLQTYRVQEDTERLIHYVVPSILQTQRSFVNIENLKNLVVEIHDTLDRKHARDTYVNARAFLAELVLEEHLSPATVKQLDTELAEFWQRRQELERLHENYIRAYIRLVLAKNLIDYENNADAESEMVPDNVLRVILYSSRSISSFDSKIASVVMENIKTVQAQCAFNKDNMALDLACAQFDVYATKFETVRLTYHDVQNAFNLSYESLCESLDGMVVQATQSETSTLGSRLQDIAKTARESEPVMYGAVALLTVLVIVGYLMLLKYVSTPLGNISKIITIFREHHRRPRNFPRSIVREIEAINGVLPKIFEDVNQQAKKIRESQMQNRELINISFVDGLTGVKNRRALERLIDTLPSVPTGIAMLMVDIDFFKMFNDIKGHQYGDSILSTIARTLRASVENQDCVYRYGGEEFLIILQEVSGNMAQERAQKLCDTVFALGVENPGNPKTHQLTISIGVSVTTVMDNEYSMRDLISQADQALYGAKNNGRNQVVCYNTEDSRDNYNVGLDMSGGVRNKPAAGGR